MWHRFTQDFRTIILRAAKQFEADNSERDISTRHLLCALATADELPAAKLLMRMGIAPGLLQETLGRMAQSETSSGGDVPALTAEAREAVESAYRLAAELEDDYVGGEHLLFAFIREPQQSDAGRALAEAGVTWQQAGQALMAQQKWRTRAPEGIQIATLRVRQFKVGLRKKAGRIKRLAYGLFHYRKPFMPYLLFRKHHTDNPYPFYTRLRQPAYWDPQVGNWIVTRYEDVGAALAEPRLSQRIFDPSAWSPNQLPPLVQREFCCLHNSLDRQMLFQDAPAQPRQRSLVAKRFTPRVIAQMQEQMQQIASDLLDAVTPKGKMEVIADVAVPFPLLVITQMLGLPEAELARFKKWSHDYFKYLTFETTLADDLATYESVRDASAYFRALLPSRRLHPEDDLITLFLQADDNGKYLPEEEIVSNCLLLLATGNDNTTRLLGSGLLALLNRPDQWQKLCDDPGLVDSAVEELLRFDSPVHWTLRTMLEDWEMLGCQFKKGQRVHIGIGPANRDPAAFPQPDQLDITRANNRHVTFGHGSHFCLGAALTRLEAKIFFGCLISRSPQLRLAAPPEWRQDGLAFRGLKSLHVSWELVSIAPIAGIL